MATGFFDGAPLLFDCTSTQFQRTSSGVSKIENPCGLTGNFKLMMELRKEILTFRDVIDLPPCNGSTQTNELVMGTVVDLHNLYPEVVSHLAPESEKISIDQGLALFHKALQSTGDSWAKNHKWMVNMGQDSEDSLDNMTSLDQIGGRVLSKLKHLTSIAKQIFDMMDEDERNNKAGGGIRGSTIGDALTESYLDTELMDCPSPDTPTLIPPELSEIADTSYCHRSLLLPFRLKALENLKPVGIKHLFSLDISPHALTNKTQVQYNIAEETPVKESHKDTLSIVTPNPMPSVPPPPPLPPIPTPPKESTTPPLVALAKGGVRPPPLPLGARATGGALPPPPAPLGARAINVPPPPPPLGARAMGGAPPPPPPLGAAKALRPKKAATKLKRSSHMGSLYRALKGKVEGCSLNGKKVHGRRSHIGGGSTGGKQGMADALAEMTKRSAYFQQIEEDVEKHSKLILEIKAAICSFQTKDMSELVKFHKYVEQHLENLTDETQVLGRFEGFPTKKLESMRTATALYLKLEEILNTLQNWKVVPPLGRLLDKVESFFNKIKGEIDALERTKDEEAKRFQSHNIAFDFNILVRIKESMVDVSSSCMELALEERKNTKMLWRAFELAFRVYSFAGGQDDRADILTKKLALQIQTDHPQQV